MTRRWESLRKGRVLACSRAAFQNVANVGTLGGDSFGRRKAATGAVLHTLNDAKLSRFLASIEFGPDVPVRCFSHAATKGVAEDRAFVGHCFPLEDAVASEGDRLLCVRSLFRLLLPLHSPRVRGSDNLLRLIPEAGGHFLVRGKNLFGSEGLLPITG